MKNVGDTFPASVQGSRQSGGRRQQSTQVNSRDKSGALSPVQLQTLETIETVWCVCQCVSVSVSQRVCVRVPAIISASFSVDLAKYFS